MEHGSEPPGTLVDPVEWFQLQWATMERNFERLTAAARIDAVVGSPVTQGDRTVIPLAEAFSSAGWGSGGGAGSGPPPGSGAGGAAATAGPVGVGMGGGAGGGGMARARPVAVVEVTPGGTRIIPVFDWTSIGIAALTTLGAMAIGAWRMRRAARALSGTPR